jgi:hypothetical protein
MSVILIDATTADKFKQAKTTVEIRTEEGKLVGTFTPRREATPEDYEWARQQFTADEIAKARSEPGGYTTIEVLEHLRKLES